MTNEKFARWIIKKIPAATYTLRARLMAGKASKGKELGSISYWPDSSKSVEMANKIMMRIEEEAYAKGYLIWSDEHQKFLSKTEAHSAAPPPGRRLSEPGEAAVTRQAL